MASLILSLIALLSVTLPLAVQSSGGFSIELIHRDSPNSPLYNSSLSSLDLRNAAIQRSFARANHLRTLTTMSTSSSSSSIQAPLIPNTAEYLMSVSIGTPQFKVLAIADTGSDLTWTQCKPCTECYKQIPPIFDSEASSTYKTVSCNSDSCAQLPQSSCDNSSTCMYQYGYGDQSTTTGELSTDTFTFDSSNRRSVSIPKILFGCSHDSQGTFDEHGSGLVGLGAGPLSLVSQLGSSIDDKFSYCMVPYNDLSNASSLLNFGDRADVGPHAVTTPIISQASMPTFYYLNLVSISVDGDKVATSTGGGDPSGRSDKGNIIIDSGTTLTILDDSFLQPIYKKLADAVKYPKSEESSQGPLEMCFDVSGVSEGEKPSMPLFTFEFSGAEVELPLENTYMMASEGVLCLAMASSQELGGGIQIYGNTAQQNFHIGYDLGANKLSIAQADCAKL